MSGTASPVRDCLVGRGSSGSSAPKERFVEPAVIEQKSRQDKSDDRGKKEGKMVRVVHRDNKSYSPLS